VVKNADTAVYYYQLAATQGNETALRNLKDLFNAGQGG